MSTSRKNLPTSSRPSADLPADLKPNEIKILPTMPTYSREIDTHRVFSSEKGKIISGMGVPARGSGQRSAGSAERPADTLGEPSKRRYETTAKRFDGSLPSKLAAYNEDGTQRIGEDHPRVKLTNAQVEAMRDDFEAYPTGDPRHMGYRALARKYGCSKRTARDICNYDKRNQWAGRWKRVNKQ